MNKRNCSMPLIFYSWIYFWVKK